MFHTVSTDIWPATNTDQSSVVYLRKMLGLKYGTLPIKQIKILICLGLIENQKMKENSKILQPRFNDANNAMTAEALPKIRCRLGVFSSVTFFRLCLWMFPTAQSLQCFNVNFDLQFMLFTLLYKSTLFHFSFGISKFMRR